MYNQLEHYIRSEINRAEDGCLPFARFMELCLYHPQWGYYMTERPKVGKEGDFFTSPTVHAVFAETIADLFIDMCRQNGWPNPVLVEAGAGTGHMAKHILERIRTSAKDLYEEMSYVLVEGSPYHRNRQASLLAKETCNIRWYTSLAEASEDGPVKGCILSNEFFDAFPVHLLEKTKTGWMEVFVTWEEEQGRFAERLRQPQLPVLLSVIDTLPGDAPVGMRVECNLAMWKALSDMARLLAEGYVLTIDYGDEQPELYHPSRLGGTLMCYYRHQANDLPYERVGEQDITAHVNFTHLMEWGKETGFKTIYYGRQDQFLIRSGILQKAVVHQDRDPFRSEAMKRNRAIQQLLYPAGLGGTFRVLVQSKGKVRSEGLPFLKPIG